MGDVPATRHPFRWNAVRRFDQYERSGFPANLVAYRWAQNGQPQARLLDRHLGHASRGHAGIDFTNFALRRLLGHSHPIGYPLPSGDDFLKLQSMGQRSSWIYEQGLLRFGVRPMP